MSRRIAVFARPPVAGRVKTRLAPALTESLACSLYRACLADALDAARRARAEERRIYWADPPSPATEGVDRAGFDGRVQRGDDLGARLDAAFAELLVAPEDRALVLGADCPALDGERIDRALDALERADAAFGPARDGGYYLVALRGRPRDLFAGVAWSTARVLDQTLSRARATGLRVELLDPLDDLDTPEDLVRLIARCAAPPPGFAAHTVDALRAMGLAPGE